MPLVVSQCVDLDDPQAFVQLFKVVLTFDKFHTVERIPDSGEIVCT